MSRRGESIYKRKDGRWEARYLKQVDIDGTKKYASVYAKTYREVKAKKLEAQLKQEQYPTCKKMTVERVMMEWLHYEKNEIKQSSYQKYASLTKNHIIPLLGKIEISQLTNQRITAFTDTLYHDGRVGGGPLSKKSVNDILIILKMALNYAAEQHHVYVPKVKLMKEKRKEAYVLSEEEIVRLLNDLFQNTDETKFGILLALYTGMRIGEVCALRWEDVHESYIYVTQTVYRLSENGKTRLHYGDPKSVSSIRLIPIHETLKPFINYYRKEAGFVLQTSQGKPVEPRLLQQRFQKICKNLNLKNVTFHTLRHTFATRCIEVGFDVKTLSEILGHSDVKTTLNRYVHSSFAQKQKNMSKLHYQQP